MNNIRKLLSDDNGLEIIKDLEEESGNRLIKSKRQIPFWVKFSKQKALYNKIEVSEYNLFLSESCHSYSAETSLYEIYTYHETLFNPNHSSRYN